MRNAPETKAPLAEQRRPAASRSELPPDRTERTEASIHNWRRSLYALWLAQLLAIVAFSMRAPFLPFFIEDLGQTSTEAQALWSGIINAGGALIMAIAAPIWGVLADRFGRKPMVLRSMYVATLTIGLMGLATSAWHLLALRMVEGAFTGTVTAVAALAAATVPRDRVGFGLGLMQMAVFSGSSFGPLVGGVLSDIFGYRATFGIASAFMLTGGLIVTFVVEERFKPVSPAERRKAGGSTWALLGIPIVLTMVLAMFMIRGTSMAIQPILPLFVETLGGHGALSEATLSGLILGAQGVTSAVASIYLGRLGDRIGYRRILAVAAFAAGFLYMPMAIVTQAWHLLVLQALFGIAAGGLVPTANAIVANATHPSQRGAVFGLVAGAGSLGAFVGPLATSGVVASFGFSPAFVLTGLILIATAVAIAYVFRRTPEPAEPELEVAD